jgi:predicted nucleic acid-binding protein
MRLVVADTSPIFYLFSIDLIDVLPQLFGKIFVPDAVYKELCHPTAPQAVREWALTRPTWMEVTKVSASNDAALPSFDEGERAAIALAELLHANLILIDERKGTSVALSTGFEVTAELWACWTWPPGAV